MAASCADTGSASEVILKLPKEISAVGAAKYESDACTAAVTRPLALTVRPANVPMLELTVASVPVPVTLPVPSNEALV